jgi:hypothetical protein
MDEFLSNFVRSRPPSSRIFIALGVRLGVTFHGGAFAPLPEGRCPRSTSRRRQRLHRAAHALDRSVVVTGSWWICRRISWGRAGASGPEMRRPSTLQAICRGTLAMEQINAAFRKHIDRGGLSIVKGGGFKTAGANITTKAHGRPHHR